MVKCGTQYLVVQVLPKDQQDEAFDNEGAKMYSVLHMKKKRDTTQTSSAAMHIKPDVNDGKWLFTASEFVSKLAEPDTIKKGRQMFYQFVQLKKFEAKVE